MKMHRWSVFGAKSLPSPLQDGPFWSSLGRFGGFRGAFRPHRGSQYAPKIVFLGTGWHLDPPIMLFGRVLEKTCKFDEKSRRISKDLDGLEPRLALCSSLITHFRLFQKNRKIVAKRDHKVEAFCSKNSPWASQG